jgi:hypothetical protein
LIQRALPVLLLLLVATVRIARADSPLTSSTFWEAYQDVPEVAQAHEAQRLNAGLTAYLLSDAPLDRKVAVINALSWDLKGTQNYVLFRDALGERYRVAPDDVDARLTAPEQLCLGYLTAIDNYVAADLGVPLLDAARRRLPRSYTVAMIAALAHAQTQIFHPDRIWAPVGAVEKDHTLEMDMRPKAREMILDYMRLYKKR